LAKGQTEAKAPEGWIDGNGGSISTLAELRWLSEATEAWDEDWSLIADIDATETRNWNIVDSDTLGFSPIGDRPYDGPRQQISFKGSFNGKGHVIEHLFINRSDESYIGLFGYTYYHVTIENLGIENCNISGYNNVGSLVGYNFFSSSVSQCHATGIILGNRYVGGLVGQNIDYSIVSHCYSNCSVFGDSNVGGLIGYNYRHAEVNWNSANGKVDSKNGYNGGLVGTNEHYSVVKGNYSSDTVLGHFNVGGLIGHNIRSEVSENYSSSIVMGYSSVGGLVGENIGPASINNCYSCGEVISSYGSVGGIVGSNRDLGDVFNCYSIAKMEGNAIGGIVKNNLGQSTVRYCYFDTIITNTHLGIAHDENNQTTTGFSAVDFSNQNNFQTWDFSDIWEIAIIPELDSNKRPYLRWQLYDFQISVVSNIRHAGIIQGESYYNNGDEVSLKVIPKEGYEFIAWTLGSDTVSYSNSFSFIFLADSSQEYVAHFREDFTFANGEGTIEHPYQIETLQHLGYLSNVTSLWNKHFILIDDIDAAETVSWNDLNGSPLGFSPIGDRDSDGSRQQIEFSGSFNGNGHTISGIFISRPGENNVGLFGCTYGATIKQLGLTNLDLSGKDNTGGLVGVNRGEINKCYCSGIIRGNSVIGGIVGYNSGSRVDKIIDSYTFAAVSGGHYAGGMVGRNFVSAIKNCYAVGGVAGNPESTGGLIGFNISDSVSNTYFDITSSGTTTGIGGWISDTTGCVGLLTDAFSNQENFDNWDFLNIWEIAILEDMDSVKHPYLKWQSHRFSVTFQKEGRGEILGNTSQTVAYGAEATTVIARPFKGEQFLSWKDGSGNLISTDSLLVIRNVISNITLTAIFTENSIGISTKRSGDFRIYPNPAKNVLFIESEIPATLCIFDINGRSIISTQEISNPTEEVPIGHLPSGVYLIKIQTSRVNHLRRFIIN